MKPADLKNCRDKFGLSCASAGEFLGLRASTVWKLEQGTRAIPRVVALAGAALARDLRPWPEPPPVRRPKPADDGLPITVESLMPDGSRTDQVLARAANVMVARAAYSAAVKLDGGRRTIILRQRAHVFEKTEARS